MRPSRARLINAARHAMLQRAELNRKLGAATDAFKPAALLGRGKYLAGKKIDDTVLAARKEFRDNRWPIAIAAAAGALWLLREPIKDHAPRLTRKIQDLTASVTNRFQSGPADTADDSNDGEDKNETVQ